MAHTLCCHLPSPSSPSSPALPLSNPQLSLSLCSGASQRARLLFRVDSFSSHQPSAPAPLFAPDVRASSARPPRSAQSRQPNFLPILTNGRALSNQLLKDDSHTNFSTFTNEAKQERLELQEPGSGVDVVAERASVLQITNKGNDSRSILMRIGCVAASAVTFLACYQAWAAPELARVQEAASWWQDLDDIKSGFVSAFLLIFFSEIGDKTFFIAAVLASRKSTGAVFAGTFGALMAMTFISVFLGRTFHYIDGILPFSLGEMELPLDDLAAVVLLVYFGATTLLEAASLDGSKAEEEQQEAELAIAGLGLSGEGSVISNTALSTFGLVFVAEWGDKSFFSTIALSAASSPIGVVSGAIAGHGLATLLAVVGGSFLSSYISERVTGYIGGSLFLVFAAFTLYEIFN